MDPASHRLGSALCIASAVAFGAMAIFGKLAYDAGVGRGRGEEERGGEGGEQSGQGSPESGGHGHQIGRLGRCPYRA